MTNTLKRNKFIFLFLLVFTGIFDLYTTLINYNFIKLEANPLFILTGSILPILLTKLILISLLGYYFLNAHKHTRFKQYFWTYMVVLLTVGQLVAGINNMVLKERIKDEVELKTNTTFDTYSDIPVEEINEYVPDNKVKLKANFIINFMVILLPMFISFVSFKLWEYFFIKNNI